MSLDLWWALRWLRKNPLFTAAVVFILALGIGANTAVFSIVDAVLLRPSPYPAADRLVRIEESTTSRNLTDVPVKDYQRWAGRNDLFEKTGPYIRDTVTLTGGGEPEQVIAVRSLGLFPLLGVPARLGRTLVASDDAEGSQNVAVLSDRLWRRRYHADPGGDRPLHHHLRRGLHDCRRDAAGFRVPLFRGRTVDAAAPDADLALASGDGPPAGGGLGGAGPERARNRGAPDGTGSAERSRRP